MPGKAKKVFISYRRDDTASVAGRMYDRLSRLLTRENVFFDVTTLSGGEEFEKSIAAAIGRSEAALIFIGEEWCAGAPDTNQMRLWEANDIVRAEVRAALERPMLVLPLLVSGARMPKPEHLPEDIRALAKRSALPLRHESFDADAENIFAAIMGVSTRPRFWNKGRYLTSNAIMTLVGAILASILMLLAGLVHSWVLARPLAASIGELATMLLLVVSIAVGGFLGFRYAALKRNS